MSKPAPEAIGSRHNDLDGRCNLSEEALVEFSRYFLDICLDQIVFMEGLMRPNELRAAS